MEISIFGAGKEVTGSCYGISTATDNILVDCGMFQGSKDLERMNYEDFNFDPSKYKALLLTHAHLDHSGRIPKLVRYGFKGKIYATDATKALAFIIMMDSAKIAAQDTKEENKRRAKEGLPARKPLYNETDVQKAMKLFKEVTYDQEVEITSNIKAKFYDAGHILGAASIQVEVTEEKKKTTLAFSGDIGQSEGIIVKDTEPIKKADYVFMESTYGDRLHPPIGERQKELLRIIVETYAKKGKLMIPSFAVERTQELLYCIGNFQQEALAPIINVYLDSPMAIKATAVFTKFPEYYNDEIRKSLKKRSNPFSFPKLINTEKMEDSRKINGESSPCIIIAGNGMCSAGRIKQHIKNNIEDPKNTLLFVGYQAEGTLGYWIKNGEKRVHLLGSEVSVNAKIESIEGFSAHADYKGLIKWVKNFSPAPKKVFIVHGEEKESLSLSKKLDKEGYKNYVPALGEKITI